MTFNAVFAQGNPISDTMASIVNNIGQLICVDVFYPRMTSDLYLWLCFL